MRLENRNLFKLAGSGAGTGSTCQSPTELGLGPQLLP